MVQPLMDKYKPTYLGKVIPADNQAKMTEFVTNKYDAFTKVYDACKEQSENITDIKTVETSNEDPNSLSVKLSTDNETMEAIKENTKSDDTVTVNADVITANS